MKTSIEGFSQAYAMTLKKKVDIKDKVIERKIDCTDLVILRWFVDFFPKMKKIEINGVQYAWLSHKKLCEDLPLIDINKRAFIERMQKLVDFGILTYVFDKESGSLSLYGFGDNYINLITSNSIGCVNESERGIRSNDIGVCVQTDNNNTIIDKTNIDKENNCYTITKENSKKPSNDECLEILNYLNEKAGTRYRAVESNLRLIRGRLRDYTLDDLKSVVDNKVKDWKGTAYQQYLRPETLFGPTKFESYLNGLSIIKDRPNHGYEEREYVKCEANNVYTNIDEVNLFDI